MQRDIDLEMMSLRAQVNSLTEQLRRQGENRPPGSLSYEERRSLPLIVLADKDGDGDMDALTSTSWDGDARSTSTGTINWHSVFGVPVGARAVWVKVLLQDSGATPNTAYIWMKARSGTTTASLDVRNSVVSDAPNTGFGLVPIAPDGTSYYDIAASGVGTCDIWLQVVGWL